MNKIKQWYADNYSQITWFLIGFLVMCGLSDLANHSYADAVISWLLAGINYIFVRR